MKKIILALLLFNVIEGNTQEYIEVISSGTSGDAVLKIEADTDNNNNNEGDNSWIELKQDRGVNLVYDSSRKANSKSK